MKDSSYTSLRTLSSGQFTKIEYGCRFLVIINGLDPFFKKGQDTHNSCATSSSASCINEPGWKWAAGRANTIVWLESGVIWTQYCEQWLNLLLAMPFLPGFSYRKWWEKPFQLKSKAAVIISFTGAMCQSVYNMKVVLHNRRLFSYTTKQLKSRLNCWGVGGDQIRKRTESGTLRVSAGQNHPYKPSLRFLMSASAQSYANIHELEITVLRDSCGFTAPFFLLFLSIHPSEP